MINKESLSSTKPEGKYKIMVKFPDQNAAASAYKDISETTSFVEKDAKIVKYLDAREVERAEEAKVAQDERMAVESMVDELFAKGVYSDKADTCKEEMSEVFNRGGFTKTFEKDVRAI